MNSHRVHIPLSIRVILEPGLIVDVRSLTKFYEVNTRWVLTFQINSHLIYYAGVTLGPSTLRD